MKKKVLTVFIVVLMLLPGSLVVSASADTICNNDGVQIEATGGIMPNRPPLSHPPAPIPTKPPVPPGSGGGGGGCGRNPSILSSYVDS